MNKPITKKAAHATRVEDNKRAAYLKKVRALIGYVGERMDAKAAVAAYEAKIDALQYAAQIVALEPVGAAVWPLKSEAVAAATQTANEAVEKNLLKLAAAGWDANKVAPYPKYVSKFSKNVTNDQYREYERARDRHSYAHAFVSPLPTGENNLSAKHHPENGPCIVARDEEKVLRHVTQIEEATADFYNSFVCKLVGKIGPDVVSATLEGNHVWSESILTVTLKDGAVQRWKTQQITNCSVLGKYFPQWPTRLMKGEG